MNEDINFDFVDFVVFCCSRKNESSVSESDKGLLKIHDPYPADSLTTTIKFDSTYQDIFPDATIGAALNHEEIGICEEFLREQVKKYNLSSLRKFKELTKKYPDRKFDLNDFEIALKPYGRQYLAVISKNGDKLVYVGSA